MGLHAVAGAAREATRVYSVQADKDMATQVAKDYIRKSYFDVNAVRLEFKDEPSAVPGFRSLSCALEIDYEDVSIISDPFNFGGNPVRGYASMLTQE